MLHSDMPFFQGSDSVTLPYLMKDPPVYVIPSVVLVKRRASEACQSWQ